MGGVKDASGDYQGGIIPQIDGSPQPGSERKDAARVPPHAIRTLQNFINSISRKTPQGDSAHETFLATA
jgi:hypothetical protein